MFSRDLRPPIRIEDSVIGFLLKEVMSLFFIIITLLNSKKLKSYLQTFIYSKINIEKKTDSAIEPK